ncbi:MAG TPA: DUF424 family protein [Candidatus Nanoarchaeia archaeon]|nr:DUF424 family protein [Candidatus Nanoarchaeia archaeon]
MKFYIKTHESIRSYVIAIADENLIGKKIKDKIIEINISEQFYKGQLCNEKKAAILLQECPNINIIGKNIIKLAKKLNLINEENIVYFKNVPHCQIYCI